jgi:hypothetical protein
LALGKREGKQPTEAKIKAFKVNMKAIHSERWYLISGLEYGTKPNNT